MCRSPHEMTTPEIEERARDISRFMERSNTNMTQKLKDLYVWRLNEYENILKERAEAGVI
jgi:hypothetical protein